MDETAYIARINKMKKKKKGERYYIIVHGKKLYGLDKAELKEKVKERLRELDTEKHPEKTTVADYLALWLEYMSRRVSPQTLEDYNYYAITVGRLFGRKKVEDLKPLQLENDLQKFANKKLDTGNYPSKSYLDHLRNVLRQMCALAVKEGIISSNPAVELKVTVKGATGEGHRSLKEHEIHAVLNTEHEMQIPAMIMLLAGLRPEEVVPLTYADIKEPDGDGWTRIYVNKRAVLRSDKPTKVIKGAKTSAGIRTVYCPEPLASALIVEKMTHPDGEFLIGMTETRKKYPGKDGKERYRWVSYPRKELLTYTALRYRWKKYIDYLIAKNPKVKKFSMYDLRHTFITRLAVAGTPPLLTAAAAGHAKSSTSEKFYVDRSKLPVEKAAEYLDLHIAKIEDKIEKMSEKTPKADKKADIKK